MNFPLNSKRHRADNLGMDDEWVTYYEVWHPGLERWVLVQKCDGRTRSVLR
jgi:hypothetical protein